MLAAGMTPRDISLELNLTTQAVYLHMQAIREAALRSTAGEAAS